MDLGGREAPPRPISDYPLFLMRIIIAQRNVYFVELLTIRRGERRGAGKRSKEAFKPRSELTVVS